MICGRPNRQPRKLSPRIDGDELDGLREAGFFEQPGGLALGDIPAQTENVRENILRGLAAVDAMLSHPGAGVNTELNNVMYRPDFAELEIDINGRMMAASPNIDFLWGSAFQTDNGEPYGLVHLIAKHGVEELVHMVNTIANGEIEEVETVTEPRLSIKLTLRHDDRRVVLSLLNTARNAPATWVMTAYEVDLFKRDQSLFNISQIDRSTLLFRQETESF